MKSPALIAQLTRPALSDFAKQLRAARMYTGMSRTRLARRAGMTRQGIVKIENGRNVTLATVIMLADALGYQVADFFPRKAPWD
jgi:transcriptional regulator with XRE-family HTH domain